MSIRSFQHYGWTTVTSNMPLAEPGWPSVLTSTQWRRKSPDPPQILGSSSHYTDLATGCSFIPSMPSHKYCQHMEIITHLLKTLKIEEVERRSGTQLEDHGSGPGVLALDDISPALQCTVETEESLYTRRVSLSSNFSNHQGRRWAGLAQSILRPGQWLGNRGIGARFSNSCSIFIFSPKLPGRLWFLQPPIQSVPWTFPRGEKTDRWVKVSSNSMQCWG